MACEHHIPSAISNSWVTRREPGPAAALALVRENLDYLERTIRPLTDP